MRINVEATGGRARARTPTVPVVLVFSLALSFAANPAPAQGPVPVLYPEGVVHGFLALKNMDGEVIAEGDVMQTPKGDLVTARMSFRFKDGSLQEETVVFSQRKHFRLLSDHLVQKGPSFKQPIDVFVDGKSGQVTVRYKEDDGKEKIINERLKLTPDLANGMTTTLLKNMQPGSETVVSMVTATPKPRVVKLHISTEGEDTFRASGLTRRATRYVIRIKIGGVAGVVAPLVGKQPEDIRVWILGGEAPTFIRSVGQLFPGGPLWRIELASPVWQERKTEN
jgi:hypothetical protein